MKHQTVSDQLSLTQRNMLVRHIDGETFVKLQVDVRGKGTLPTMRSLMDMGLLRYSGWKSVQTTQLTDDGRKVLALLLASYAEALIQAGYGIEVERKSAIAPLAKRLLADLTHLNPPDLPDTSPGCEEASPPAAVPERQLQSAEHGAD